MPGSTGRDSRCPGNDVPPVCIAGMHRSGTSMTAKLLHEAGLYLGPASDLHPREPANHEGHWENRWFRKLNRRVLKQLGGEWDYPPPIPESWTGEDLAPQRSRAGKLLEHFAGREPWGWKDPRTCLTLPFWQGMLGEIRVVVVVRNPLEVAESLRKRNGFSLTLGLALWHAYNRRLFDATTPSDRLVTHYGTYFRDPERELRRLLSFLAMPGDEKIVAKASVIRETGLRHHHLTAEDLVEANVAPEIRGLYQDLCREADWEDPEPARPAPGKAKAVQPENAAQHSRGEVYVSEFAEPPSLQLKAQGGRYRQQLQEARARIAELERTVESQRRALIEYEAAERELFKLRRLVAERAEDFGLTGDQIEELVGRGPER